MTLLKTRLGNVLALMALALPALTLSGCPSYGPAPETVDFVDIDQYAGLWYEIASNPVFFNQDLVNVTAEYTKRADGQIDVLNTGYEGSPDGPVDSIQGIARVVDTETNSKLAVRFPSVFGGIFEGEYWIVALEENYEWAVVTDSQQMTLFILSRTAAMEGELYDAIVADLDAADIDTSRLRITGTVVD